MRLSYLGDSYDIVKQSFLRWLSALGPWSANPMFTEEVPGEQIDVFARLLGVPLISTETLRPKSDRFAYFATARACHTHLFLDPDTGLRLERVGGKRAPAYLFGEELAQIARSRPGLLTLVFDQSLGRGNKAEQLEQKLLALAAVGLHGAAYVSHACFILVAHESELVREAVLAVREQSGLPSARFVRGGTAEQPDAADERRLASRSAARS
ncbi:MAG: hypothetical protein L0214_05605 [candidate division NC10 bacterium]|nr:hypothetical protein [candidate division NC10 bacterium]